DYHINDRNVITLSGSFAIEDEDQPSETDFLIEDGEDGIISSYRRTEETTAFNPKYQYDLKYEKKFKNNKEHTLQLSTLGSFFGKDLESEFFNVSLSGEQLDPNQQTETTFFKQDFIYQLDYTNTINENWTIESGGLYEINDVGNDFTVRNETEEGIFEVDSNFTNSFDFDQRVLGLYSTIAFENKTWGIKLGGRLENTDLATLLKTTDQANDQNYTNFFPSVHASYKVTERFSMQAGYSRRIFRPQLWDLNPFFNVRNVYNIRQGNPELGPEFADSYELTTIYTFDKASINTSIYHLYTTDIIERISVFEDDVNIVRPENIGTKNQTGLEINGKYQPIKKWTINGDFNYGFFSRSGQFQDQDFSFEGTIWYVKMTNRFRVKKGLDLEATVNYNSPFDTVQGEVSGFASADAGVRKKLWKGKAIINLSVRDIFASRIRESFARQDDFFLYSFSQRGRFIRLGFSYSFGKGEAMSYTGRRR
ncbi:MAG: outer membrane beta-barrel family protein, partial [Bacteroidota bacterium]